MAGRQYLGSGAWPEGIRRNGTVSQSGDKDAAFRRQKSPQFLRQFLRHLGVAFAAPVQAVSFQCDVSSGGLPDGRTAGVVFDADLGGGKIRAPCLLRDSRQRRRCGSALHSEVGSNRCHENTS